MCHIPKYCAREIISLNLDFMANFIACNSCIATVKHFCLHNPSGLWIYQIWVSTPEKIVTIKFFGIDS